jgi:hypothetical protein
MFSRFGKYSMAQVNQMVHTIDSLLRDYVSDYEEET